MNDASHALAALIVILMIIPLWRICGRAGFSPFLSLLAILPWLGVLIIGAILGFGQWPKLKPTAPSGEQP
jgi:hypothetical protein